VQLAGEATALLGLCPRRQLAGQETLALLSSPFAVSDVNGDAQDSDGMASIVLDSPPPGADPTRLGPAPDAVLDDLGPLRVLLEAPPARLIDGGQVVGVDLSAACLA
jgi:hypothetical protein